MAGWASAKLREDRRQHFRADELARGEAHRAAFAAGPAGRRARQRTRCRRHCLGVAHQPFAQLGENKAARRTAEELGAEFVFERGDVPAQRGLRETQRACGPREAAASRHFQEGTVEVPVLCHAEMYN